MIPLCDLPSGVTDFHVQELVRLMEYPRPYVFSTMVGGTALRWVYCPTCGNARFWCYPILYRTRICDDCHLELYHFTVRRYTRLLQQAVQRSLRSALHSELREVCFRPDRLVQTGMVETWSRFDQ